jgi:hypothetical protein
MDAKEVVGKRKWQECNYYSKNTPTCDHCVMSVPQYMAHQLSGWHALGALASECVRFAGYQQQGLGRGKGRFEEGEDEASRLRCNEGERWGN